MNVLLDLESVCAASHGIAEFRDIFDITVDCQNFFFSEKKVLYYVC